MVSATRTVNPLLPAETGFVDGLAYSLWLPLAGQPAPRAGVVIVHGADSRKESHHDFARRSVVLGLGAICFDQRGHGESAGRLGAGAPDDVARIGDLLRERLGADRAPIALRGSSMGGYLAILAAQRADAQAVVAICPASAAGLKRGLLDGRFEFGADTGALAAFLDEHPLTAVAGELTVPVLLMHAEGDERVPIAHSRELAGLLRHPDSRLLAMPGGHHRSIQHDEELQAVSLRFITGALGARPSPRAYRAPDG